MTGIGSRVNARPLTRQRLSPNIYPRRVLALALFWMVTSATIGGAGVLTVQSEPSRAWHNGCIVLPAGEVYASAQWDAIGYGHSTPKTAIGKIFCMCYAALGIPLTLIMFQSIGERMNTLITRVLRHARRHLGCRSLQVSQTHLMLVSFTTGLAVLTCGAVVFSQFEEWAYLDAFYYCFITLTTIGFGDYVALQRDDYMAKRPEYVAFSLIFIIFGLTVMSSVMNLLVLRCLTLNTEDERRDQLAAAAHAQQLKRLHGDVIWVESDGRETSDTNLVSLVNKEKPETNHFSNSNSSNSTNSEGLQHFFTGILSWFVNGRQMNSPSSRRRHRCPAQSLRQPAPQVITEPLCGTWGSPYHHHCNQSYGNSNSDTLACPHCPHDESSRQLMVYRAAKVNGAELSLACGGQPMMDRHHTHSDDRLALVPRFTDSHEFLATVGHSNTDELLPYICTKPVYANCHVNYTRLIAQGHSSYSMSSLYSYITLQEEDLKRGCGNFPNGDYDSSSELAPNCSATKKERAKRIKRLKQRLHVTTNQLFLTNRYVSMSAEQSRQSLDVSLDSVQEDEVREAMRRSYAHRKRRQSVSI